MVTGAEEIAAAKAAVAIVQLAKDQGWLQKLFDVFKTKHQVLVLGSTGTGKSNFLESLQTVVPEAINRMARTEEKQSKEVHLAGEIFHFLDTPGQEAHKPKRIQAITEMLQKKQFGVINVVSDGYHEYRTGKAEAVTDGKPNPTWLEDHRKVELVSAAEWAQLMTARPEYVITVVTKADLWWPDSESVIKYYESGRYSKVIHEAAIHGHVVAPYSSVNHRFYGIAPMSGTFESKDRTECQAQLLKSLFTSVARA